MSYLKIKNNGIMEPQALTLMGASSKTDDNTKIGMFGSGNKYAISYLIRNNIQLIIYAGTERIDIETKKESFREQSFDVIYINGEKTSITTTMGKDWELWQALREIYCNSLDEGGAEIGMVEDVQPVYGETHFYIHITDEVAEFMVGFDSYFSTHKAILEETPIGKLFVSSSKSVNIYRKGIRCYDTHLPSKYDYDFNEIHINESRVVGAEWRLGEEFWKLFISLKNHTHIFNIIRAMGSRDNFECMTSSAMHFSTHSASEEFIALIATLKLAPMESGGLCTSDEQAIFNFIPSRVYEALEPHMSDENKAMMFDYRVNGEFYHEIEANELQKATIERAMEFFKECQYDIDYEIKVVSFNTKTILGTAKDDIIYVSDIAIEKGIHDLCNTIIEEQVHLKYDVEDETREFQLAVINEMLTVMKKAYAFPM